MRVLTTILVLLSITIENNNVVNDDRLSNNINNDHSRNTIHNNNDSPSDNNKLQLCTPIPSMPAEKKKLPDANPASEEMKRHRTNPTRCLPTLITPKPRMRSGHGAVRVDYMLCVPGSTLWSFDQLCKRGICRPPEATTHSGPTVPLLLSFFVHSLWLIELWGSQP